MKCRGGSGAGVSAPLVVGVLALFLLSSCDHTPPRLKVVYRATAERHQRAGNPSTVHVPSVEIDGMSRLVLADSDATVLWYDVLAPDEQRAGEVDVAIPPALQGAPLQIDVTRALYGVELSAANARKLLQAAVAFAIPATGASAPLNPTIAHLPPHTIASAAPEERIAYAFSDDDPEHTALLLVTGRPMAERSYTTALLTVPAEARLRFGVGLDGPARTGQPRVRFTVTLLSDDGEDTIFDARVDPAVNDSWHVGRDYDVSLARYAGQTFRLRFEATPDGAGGEAVYPVWANPRILAPETVRRPNLLLISIDTLRADHLGCYGYGRPTSPTIDGLAAEGTLFARAYAEYPQTSGSHMTMLTSLEPCVHRVLGPAGSVLRSDAETLAELLRAHGYTTAAFTEDGWINAASGFARGFGTYVEETDAGLARGTAALTFERGLKWIRSRAGTRWFVFLHTYQTHEPYSPPEGYTERVAAGQSDDVARYDGEIRYTDDLLARVFASLDELGLAGDTVVVLTSDHGELFGEHGLTGHDNSLYDELLHVPLVVRAPGLAPAGKRIDTPVGLVDLVPTVLDLLGLPRARWNQGRSVAPLLRDEPLAPERRYAWWHGMASVREPDGRKWILNTQRGTARLFALSTDPRETQNIAPKAPAGSQQAALAAVRARCVAPPSPDGPAPNASLDPRVRQKLEALGYLD